MKALSRSAAQATALSCSIFYTLLVKFRRALKAEISEFFPKIFLRPMEAPPAAALASAAGAPARVPCCLRQSF